jgi:epoxyqueuosine reductase
LAINSDTIREEAQKLGFFYCGFAKAERLDKEADELESWLNKNAHGKMAYMANHFDKRVDPRELVPGARTVVSLMYNHYSEPKQVDPEAPKISRYAYGKDYHKIIKDKLFLLLAEIRKQHGDVQGRVFVDSAPVLERAWAERAGGGWVGKNTNLINKSGGSFYFLAEMILDLEIEPDGPIKDYCGTCTRCIDACPTEAIVAPYQLDGSKCISYFTIELRDEIPVDMKGKFENWAFGCDICQEVCPWNRFAKPHQEPQFEPSDELKTMTANEWQEITEEVFDRLFKDTPVTRTGFAGLKRNLRFLGF